MTSWREQPWKCLRSSIKNYFGSAGTKALLKHLNLNMTNKKIVSIARDSSEEKSRPRNKAKGTSRAKSRATGIGMTRRL